MHDIFCSYNAKKQKGDGQMDVPMEGWTDGWTDTRSCRVASLRLKMTMPLRAAMVQKTIVDHESWLAEALSIFQ